MLHHLSVRNFILIDELELEFNSGFTVITGETGAGKSILLDAILFCLGARGFDDIIKTGAEAATVTATFDLAPSIISEIQTLVQELDIEIDDQLIIKRVQTHNNRKKFLINDNIITQKTMQQIAPYLFELHGQNNHTILLNASSHIDILDNYGNLLELKKSVSTAYYNYQTIIKNIAEIENHRISIEKDIDYLNFVVAELRKADIKLGEEENLSNIKITLQHQEREIKFINDILEELGNENLSQALARSLRMIARSNAGDGNLAEVAKNIEEAYNNLEEAKSQLHSTLSNIRSSDHDLQHIEDRLYEIKSLARKYNIPSNELQNFLNESEKQLENLKNKITNSHQLKANLLEATNKYYELANNLNQKRLFASKELQQKVQSQLAFLHMPKALFKIDLTEKEATSNGVDNVRFIASTNPGMPPSPIDKIASGGELSRFMLAIKVALLDKNSLSTIIFDEIDTGISGAVASSVGECFATLGKATQVVVVTHQPQVAAKAQHHLFVSKTQLNDDTKVTINLLSTQDRVSAIAKMISGKIVTEESIKAATSLLNDNS